MVPFVLVASLFPLVFSQIHFRGLQTYTTGYIVTRSYPSSDCFGIPMISYVALGSCQKDSNSIYLSIAESTITSYWSISSQGFNYTGCSDLITTETTLVNKGCVSSSATSSSRISYSSTVAAISEPGLLSLDFQSPLECASSDFFSEAIFTPISLCYPNENGTFSKLLSCEETGNSGIKGITIVNQNYGDNGCQVPDGFSFSWSSLSCDGNGAFGGLARFSCTHHGMPTWHPTAAPSTPSPTAGVTSPTPLPTATPTTLAPTAFPTNSMVGNDGYFVMSTISDFNCYETAPSWQSMYRLNRCVQTLDIGTHLSVRYSDYWYNSSDGSFAVTMQTFSNPACDGAAASSTRQWYTPGECVSMSQNVSNQFSFSASFPEEMRDRVLYRYFETSSDCSQEDSDSLVVYAQSFAAHGCLNGQPFGTFSQAASISECRSYDFTESTYSDVNCETPVTTFQEPLYQCVAGPNGFLHASCNFDHNRVYKMPKDYIYLLFLLFLLAPIFVFIGLKWYYKPRNIQGKDEEGNGAELVEVRGEGKGAKTSSGGRA